MEPSGAGATRPSGPSRAPRSFSKKQRQAMSRKISFGAAACNTFNLETEWNGPTIHAVISLDTAPDETELIAFLNRVCGMSERFSSRILPNEATGAREWVAVEDFTVDEVLHKLTLPGENCQQELEDLITDKLTQFFSPGMPYWEVYVVDYEAADKHDLVIRICHSVADGVTLASVLIHCTEYAEEDPGEPSMTGHSWANLAAAEARKQKQAKAPAKTDSWVTSILSASRTWLWRCYVTAAEVFNVLLLPSLPADAASPIFRGDTACSPDRAICWTDVELGPIKQASKVAGTTINDIVHAAMSIGLRRYMAEKGPHPDSIRTFCIFNLRRLKGLRPNGFCPNARFGNDFTYAISPIMLRDAPPAEVLYKSKSIMDRLKASGQPYFVQRLNLAIEAILPWNVVMKIMNTILAKCTFMFSNLAGPSAPVKLAGARVNRIYNHVNMPGGVPLLMSFLSYNGRLNIAITADKAVVSDPQNISNYMIDGFKEICGAFLTAEKHQAGATGTSRGNVEE